MYAARAACLITVLVAAAACRGAAATELRPDQSIAERERPELDATGLPVGALRLYPTLGLSARHDSNLFARDDAEQDDLITLLSPGAELVSDWSRHALEAGFRADIAKYRDSPQEDFSDLFANASLRFDLGRASELRLHASFDDLHEDRASPDDVQGLEPTPVQRNELGARYAQRIGRLVLDGRVRHSVHDYDDVPGAAGPINNDDRDRERTTAELRAGLQFARELQIALRAEADGQRYDAPLDDSGLDRGSDGWRGGLGLQGVLGGSYIEAFAGYERRGYRDPSLQDTLTPWLDLQLVWSPTGLTTFRLNAERRIDETTFAPASGFRAARIALDVDHELLRNLLLNAGVMLQRDRYIGVDRDDERSAVSFGARYLVNRYLRVELRVSRRSRASDLGGVRTRDFDIDTATLTVTLQR